MPQYRKKDFATEKLFSALWFRNYALIILGSFLVSFGYVLFIVPHSIVPGGVFGLSIVISRLTGLPIGATALAINIPILLIGVKVIGGRFGLKTVFSMVLCSLFIDGLNYLLPATVITEDLIVTALFGGAVIGSGIALVIIAGATTGGTDNIARIIAYYLRMPIGKMLLLIDGFIVLLGIIVFRNLDIAPYSVIAIFSITKTIDVIQHGINVNKSAFIVSDKHKIIRDHILEMDCGGTYLSGEGLFFKDAEKRVIFTVLSNRKMSELEQFIKAADPEAFVATMFNNDVFGAGFKQLD
jgi:uncharacterized membrane-anchored protein YitT (DUF2179 family)